MPENHQSPSFLLPLRDFHQLLTHEMSPELRRKLAMRAAQGIYSRGGIHIANSSEDVFWREGHVTSTKSMPDRTGKKTQQTHQLFFFELSKSIGWLQFLQISFVAGEKQRVYVYCNRDAEHAADRLLNFYTSCKASIKKRTPAVHNYFG